MKRVFLYILTIVSILACEKSNENENGNENGQTSEEPKETPKDYSIQGYAQKGQFVKGSQITAFAIGTDLGATGDSFPTSISNDLGAFAIAGKTTAPYIEIRAAGYYFDELKGMISTNPLYLEAFVKSDDKNANINLMTTAIRPRVKKLIKEGKSFDAAMNQAQAELLKSLGFAGSIGYFDDMNITGTTEADGMLLAFACMVQSGRDASQITALIQDVASELETKGELSAALYEKIKSGIPAINPFLVIENLAKYYTEKKLTVESVPAFYKFLDQKYDIPFLIVDGSLVTENSQSITDPGAIEGGLSILASIDFSVESENKDVIITKEHILGPAYRVSYSIPANVDLQERNIHIIFKDASGSILYQKEFFQGGDSEILLINYDVQTKTSFTIYDDQIESPFKEGTEISVNGEVFALKTFNEFPGMLGVAVPKAKQYAVSYPAYSVGVTDHISRVKVSVESELHSDQGPCFYGAIAPFGDMAIQNPGVVSMKPILAKLRFKLDDSIVKDWSYLVVSSNYETEYLSGTASFLADEKDLYLYYGLDPAIVFDNDGKRTIKIFKSSDSQFVNCYTFPQLLNYGLSVYVYDNKDKLIGRLLVKQEVSLKSGTIYAFGSIPFLSEPVSFTIGQVLPNWEEGYLDIHCINGGRGEAFYYILPDGTTMLIDAAGAPPNELTSYDSNSPGVASRPSVNINSGKVIVNYIKHFAPSVAGGKLDYFVSSHYHGDHIGSWRSDYNKYGWTPYDKNGSPVSSINLNDGGFLLNGLAEVGLAIPIVKVLDRGDWDKPASEEYGTDSGNKRYQLYLNFLDYAKRKNGTVRETFKVGTTDQLILKHDPGKYSSFKVRSVAAGGHVWTGSGTQEATQFPSVEECLKNKDNYSIGENHLSCVLLMQYGSFDHFTGGDICYNGYSTYSWKHVEKTIAKAMKKVEVMKASHHSTNNTNSTELLSVLKPDIYIAGVWRAVQPSPTTLKRVLTANPNTKIFTTNLDASNVTTLKADGIDPATFGCTGGHVVVRVAKGGTKYWVLVLDDSDEQYFVKSIYGPYPCVPDILEDVGEGEEWNWED